jgi:hypothetical protein
MKASLFIGLIAQWFSTIKGKIEEKINGNKEAGKYLHEEVLTPEYTSDLRWDSASVDDSVVAADVVALDSPLPLKTRGSLAKASGTIAKTGMKKVLNESQITQLNILLKLGKFTQLIAKLFDDSPKCALGIKERIEMMFLEAISTGYTVVGTTDGDVKAAGEEENTGTAVRANFGYLPENKYGATVKWGKDGYTPISDIKRVLDSIDSTISVIWISKAAYNLLRSSQEAKELYANYRAIPILENSILPTPTKDQFNEAFNDEYGVTFRVIDREIVTEKNGKRRKVKPFSADTLVFLTQDDNLGRVVYGELAEETNPVEGVKYEKVSAYILLSKYGKNDPLREFTSAQALVLPVIDGVSEIYLLNTQEALEVADTDKDAGGNDANITVYDNTYAKTDVIAKLKECGVKCPSNISDTTLIAKINGLNDEDEANFKAAIETLTPVA